MHNMNSEFRLKRRLPVIAAWITGFLFGAALFSMHGYAAPPANTIKQSSPRCSTPSVPAENRGRPSPSLEQQVQQLTQKLSQLKQTVQSLQASNSAVGQQQQGMHGRISALENTISVSPSGTVTLSTAGTLKLTASLVELSAATVKLQTAITITDGVLEAESVIANSIIAASYTPGAGNIW